MKIENLRLVNGVYVSQKECSEIIENATSKAFQEKAKNKSLSLDNQEKPFAQKIASNMRAFGYARVDRLDDDILISF
jgi:hypothetical protein